MIMDSLQCFYYCKDSANSSRLREYAESVKLLVHKLLLLYCAVGTSNSTLIIMMASTYAWVTLNSLNPPENLCIMRFPKTIKVHNNYDNAQSAMLLS